MKRVATLFLAAAMLLGAANSASAIDFKIGGEWYMGFGVGQANLINKFRAPGADGKVRADSNDEFQALQMARLKLEAMASEHLSGTLYFEIGDTTWGKADGFSGALGADQTSAIKLKNAYLDWSVPDTALKFRMGIQDVTLPNMAGGPAVFSTDAAGLIASYEFNDNVALTAMWVRPFNDNYKGVGYGYGHDNPSKTDGYRASYLDNMDLFGLLLPLKFDGFEATPWVMYGMRGKNTGNFEAYQENDLGDGSPPFTFGPSPNSIYDRNTGEYGYGNIGNTGKAYGSMFWAGLPLAVTALDPFNIEFDINYGYVEAMGRYDAWRFGLQDPKRSSTQRQGWLVKALVEYKMDWGTPGIFGWYGSGDDGNPKNGSERMPTIAPVGNFTSFIGDGELGWGPNGFYDCNTSYSGTWGIGARIKDVSFVENLSHTLTVAWWGGTNAPKMAKYMDTAYAWNDSMGNMDSYLTTNDGLLEFNLVNVWKIYENLDMNLELGYIANFMDNDTWKKAGARDTSFEKKDAWKAQVVFHYSF
ncbi:MAG: outer membrane homotrimeric porin [Desulfovibrio sp.]|jgi:hypothetical protein|nr:outer membrane homotrimeric porin [Desulfovibrio sp.]